MADQLQLRPGHMIFTVRITAGPSTTPADVEGAVVGWLADALGVDHSARSGEGEWVVGAANPVTVIPLLDLSSREMADRETALCQGQNTAFLGDLPQGVTAGALVHLDWAGVATDLPTRWTHHFGTGLLEHWSPTDAGEAPGLAVTAQCHRDERARPPIKPPSVFDGVTNPSPDLDKHLRELKDALFLTAGVAGLGAALLFFWGRR